MEPSIKDKYIILGFIFVAICMISFFITIIIAASFNQDNFVRLIVFVCSNLLGWLLYLSFQTVIFDTYEIYRIKFGKKEMKEITTETVALAGRRTAEYNRTSNADSGRGKLRCTPHRAEYRPEASRRNPFKL